MSFISGWMRRGQEIRAEKDELRAEQHMKLLERQAAQQAQVQDISILEKLATRGRPVTGDGTIMEEKTLPESVPGMILGPMAGQKVQIARPVDRARIANYTDSTGQRHTFELLSEQEQMQRQIEHQVAQTRAVGGAQTAVGLDRMRGEAKVADEIDTSRAIPTPKAFQGLLPGDTMKPSQVGLLSHLATARTAEQRSQDSIKIAGMNNARMVAIQNSKNLLDWNKFTNHEKGLDSRFRQAEANKFARAKMAEVKARGVPDKEAERKVGEVRKIYDEEIATHQLAEKIGMMANAGIYADGKGNPVFVDGEAIKSNVSNASIMESQVKDLKARAEALKQQRLRLEADMEKTPLYEGSVGQKGVATGKVSVNLLNQIFSGETRIGK